MPYTNFPRQLLGDKEKDKKWCEQNLDAMSMYLSNDGNSLYVNDRYRDIRNYQVYHGHFDPKDYEYITDQYGTPFPARMTNYNIVAPKIDLLTSEELRRPLESRVISINKDAINRKEDMKISLKMREMLDDMAEKLTQATGVKLKLDNQDMPVPDDIDLFMRYTYKEMIEEVAESGLEYLIEKYRWKDLFKTGFRDLLVTGKVFYKVDILNGDPHIRRVDPRNIAYDVSNETDYLDNAQWVVEQRWLSINEILDEYRDSLTKEDVSELENIRHLSSGSELANYNKTLDWVNYDSATGLRVRLIHGEWKSIRPIKFKLSPNKYDPEKPFKKMVGDNYKPRKGEKIEIKYVDDIWQGTKIAGRIVVDCRRRPNQVRSVDDAGSTPLSYVGCIHNMSAGRVSSLVDVLKHIQMLYNVVLYHIELTLSRAGGKAVVYDVSQMPSNIGMDMQTVLYHIKNDGIIPINSRDEGADTAKFNQFQQVDFTLSNSVQQLINLKLMLEQTAGQVCGISPQREGSVSKYEYVGNVQRSVIQSNLVTETWFHNHSIVKKTLMERVCNLMKISWSEGKRAGYVLGDGSYKMLSIFPEISLNDYGVFVGTGEKDEAIKQSLVQLSQSALQSGQISLLDIIKVLKSDSLTEAQHVLEQGIEAMQKQAQQAQQQQAQMQQAEAQSKQSELEHEKEIKNIDGEYKVKTAEINADARIKAAEIESDARRDISDTQLKTRMEESAINADFEEQKDQRNFENERKKEKKVKASKPEKKVKEEVK
jgi:hypothetical protein